MEHLETLEPQSGQVCAQSTPQDNESEFQEQRFQNCVDKIQEAVSGYPVECRPKVLTAALEQTTKCKGAAEKIAEIKQEIRRACDSLLDSKSRACIALLSELSSLSGISNVGVDFATDILHSTFGQKDVKLALEQFPDDNDVALLSYVFDLAHSVVKADDKIFLQKVSEKAETIERPQAAELEDADSEEIETQDQPKQPEELCIDEQTQQRIINFYKGLDPKTKLAIATLNELQTLDGINFQARKPREERLITAIWDDIESVCIETFHKESDDVANIAFGAMTSEDVWVAGVWGAVRMVIQNC